jgi:plastocyanin
MRRLPAVLLTIVVAAALAACSSGAAPGWTYAPAASAAPAPSGAASGGPSSAPSTAASAPAAASPAPSASAEPAASASGGAGAGLTVNATTTSATSGFDPATLETAANTAFTLTFDNQDSTVAHNLVLQDSAGTAVAVQGDTKPFTGPATREYQVPALAAGDYKYICQVHPTTMVGTLTVK